MLLIDDDDYEEHNKDKIQKVIPYEYREKIKIEKNNDNYDDLIK